MVHEKLACIQQALKAPKDQFNSFGNYKYRSCESILEAVKPLLKETKTVLTLTDRIEAIGGRVYICATATLADATSADFFSVSAYAREEEAKKGMDASQVTGAASSYARKYALNGLFCIDDNKDSDATNTHGKGENPSPQSTTKAPQTPTDYKPTCVVCRAPISEAEHDYSVKNFKKPLCRACQRKEKANA